jgi:hypothetical protein
MDNFTIDIMASNYTKAYEKILNGENLNTGTLVAGEPGPFEQFWLKD